MDWWLQQDKKEIYLSVWAVDIEYTQVQKIRTLIYICLDELMGILIKALILPFSIWQYNFTCFEKLWKEENKNDCMFRARDKL